MDELNNLLKEYVKYHSPGYVIEIYNKGVEKEIIYGNRETKPNPLPCNANTFYDIASLTKTFTATLIYMAYEEQKINIYDTIFNIDNRFSNLKVVKVLDLLSHNQEIWTQGYLGDAKNKEEFYQILFSSSVKNTEPTYVDVHYIILSTILEKIYNKPFDKLLEEKIFKKLNMKMTTVNPKGKNIASNNYELFQDQVMTDIYPGTVHDRKARRAKDLGLITGHASIFTTGQELLLFLKSFLECSLLKQETIQLMLSHDDRNKINQKRKEEPQEEGKFVKTYNYMGARYFNIIEELNDVPKFCSKNSIVFTGYTGPLYMIDFDKKIIVIIMCNVMHNTRLNREKRKKLTENILEKIGEKLYLS